jgi:hypothetical protein
MQDQTSASGWTCGVCHGELFLFFDGGEPLNVLYPQYQDSCGSFPCLNCVHREGPATDSLTTNNVIWFTCTWKTISNDDDEVGLYLTSYYPDKCYFFPEDNETKNPKSDVQFLSAT